MEMPNGMKVWCGGSAEEETFFIYGEVFEDRTYARMDVRVQDGDTVWDVGETRGAMVACSIISGREASSRRAPLSAGVLAKVHLQRRGPL